MNSSSSADFLHQSIVSFQISELGNLCQLIEFVKLCVGFNFSAYPFLMCCSHSNLSPACIKVLGKSFHYFRFSLSVMFLAVFVLKPVSYSELAL